MTVEQLIRKLQEVPSDYVVFTDSDDGDHVNAVVEVVKAPRIAPEGGVVLTTVPTLICEV